MAPISRIVEARQAARGHSISCTHPIHRTHPIRHMARCIPVKRTHKARK